MTRIKRREVRYVIDFKRKFIRVQYLEAGEILRTNVICETHNRYETIEIRQPVDDSAIFPFEHDEAGDQ